MDNRKINFLDYGIIFVLILLVVIFSVASENFLKISTIFTILKQISITGIISIGMTFVITTGGIDLSVGSIAGVSAVTAAILMKNNYGTVFSCIVAIVLACLYGLINGLLITKFKMPPLIATLGTQTSLRGLAFIVTEGLPVFGFSDTFSNFANGALWQIPYPVLLLVFIFFCCKICFR